MLNATASVVLTCIGPAARDHPWVDADGTLATVQACRGTPPTAIKITTKAHSSPAPFFAQRTVANQQSCFLYQFLCSRELKTWPMHFYHASSLPKSLCQVFRSRPPRVLSISLRKSFGKSVCSRVAAAADGHTRRSGRLALVPTRLAMSLALHPTPSTLHPRPCARLSSAVSVEKSHKSHDAGSLMPSEKARNRSKGCVMA